MFNGQVAGSNYEVTVLVLEDTLSVDIKKDGTLVHSETVKSADDLKIFLEERLYQCLDVQ